MDDSVDEMLAGISRDIAAGKEPHKKPAPKKPKKAPLPKKPKSLAQQLRDISMQEDWTNGDWGHWSLKEGVTRPSTLPLGFVYLITRKSDGKFYIGQKKVIRIETRAPLKGFVKKRRYLTQSDWRTYCGSSSELIADIAAMGEDAFTFQIIQFVDSKWELSFWELWWQMRENVMFRSDTYNGIINVRLSKFKKFVEKYKNWDKNQEPPHFMK